MPNFLKNLRYASVHGSLDSLPVINLHYQVLQDLQVLNLLDLGN